MILNIDNLKKDTKYQNRANLNPEVVAEYEEAMVNGDKFPPMKVIFDSVNYYLVDGYHRYYAYLKARIFDIECDIIDGTERDAVLYACGVNSSHGLKRTNADKRKAVMTLLNDEEWGVWSDYKIAEICKVSQPFVLNIRHEIENLTNNIISDKIETLKPAVKTHINKHGQTAQMNVYNIGKKREVIEPKPVIEEPVATIDASDCKDMINDIRATVEYYRQFADRYTTDLLSQLDRLLSNFEYKIG